MTDDIQQKPIEQPEVALQEQVKQAIASLKLMESCLSRYQGVLPQTLPDNAKVRHILTVVEDRNDNDRIHVTLGDWGDHLMDMAESWGQLLADVARAIEHEYGHHLDTVCDDAYLFGAIHQSFNERVEQILRDEQNLQVQWLAEHRRIMAEQKKREQTKDSVAAQDGPKDTDEVPVKIEIHTSVPTQGDVLKIITYLNEAGFRGTIKEQRERRAAQQEQPNNLNPPDAS